MTYFIAVCFKYVLVSACWR